MLTNPRTDQNASQAIARVRTVLFCFTSLNPKDGGIARINRTILDSFVTLYPHNKAIVLTLGKKTYKSSVARNVIVLTSGSKLRFLRELVRACFNHRPDLVFYDHIGPAKTALFIKLVFRIPYLVFGHGLELDDLNFIKDRTLRNAKFIWCNSSFTKQKIERFDSKTTVLPLAFEDLSPNTQLERPNLLNALGKSVALPENYLLILGRLDPREKYKGHDFLIRSFRELPSKYKSLSLIIAGTGKDEERLRKLAQSLGVSDQILFSGYVSESQKIYLLRKCIAFAMPSLNEGFGLVYLEAMREGIPCIVSNRDAAQEIVTHDYDGFIIDPTKSKELHRCIATLIENPLKRAVLGFNARKTYESKFNMFAFHQRFMREFDKVFKNISD